MSKKTVECRKVFITRVEKSVHAATIRGLGDKEPVRLEVLSCKLEFETEAGDIITVRRNNLEELPDIQVGQEYFFKIKSKVKE